MEVDMPGAMVDVSNRVKAGYEDSSDDNRRKYVSRVGDVINEAKEASYAVETCIGIINGRDAINRIPLRS